MPLGQCLTWSKRSVSVNYDHSAMLTFAPRTQNHSYRNKLGWTYFGIFALHLAGLTWLSDSYPSTGENCKFCLFKKSLLLLSVPKQNFPILWTLWGLCISLMTNITFCPGIRMFPSPSLWACNLLREGVLSSSWLNPTWPMSHTPTAEMNNKSCFVWPPMQCLGIQAALDIESLLCLLSSRVCALTIHKTALCLIHKLAKINIFLTFMVSHTFKISNCQAELGSWFPL